MKNVSVASSANIGCKTYDHTNGTICTNNRTLSEQKITDAVISELRTQLLEPQFLNEFVAAAKRRFMERQNDDGRAVEEVQRRVQECQRRVANVTEALAATGFSAAVRTKLTQEESALAEAEARLREARCQGVSTPIGHSQADR